MINRFIFGHGVVIYYLKNVVVCDQDTDTSDLDGDVNL